MKKCDRCKKDGGIPYHNKKCTVTKRNFRGGYPFLCETCEKIVKNKQCEIINGTMKEINGVFRCIQCRVCEEKRIVNDKIKDKDVYWRNCSKCVYKSHIERGYNCKIKCVCGSVVLKLSFNGHCKSQKHIKFLKKNKK